MRKSGLVFCFIVLMATGAYGYAQAAEPAAAPAASDTHLLSSPKGDKFDTASGHDLNAGGFARMPQGMHHYAWAKSPAVVQVHGIGPFAFTYVNPADDPRNKH